MNTPTNNNEVIPILGRLIENGEVEYIGSAFVIRWIGVKYLCSAGHTFMSGDYSNFYYSLNENLVEIDMNDLKTDATNVVLKREGTERIGRKDDYAFLKIETKIEGLILDNDEVEYGEDVIYKGFSPIDVEGIAKEAEYVERRGTQYSDQDFDYSNVPTGMSRPVRLKMHNIRKALIEDCVQGNSGGAILRESNGQAIGLLTNGRDGTIVYLTADYLMEKIIELFNIGES